MRPDAPILVDASTTRRSATGMEVVAEQIAQRLAAALPRQVEVLRSSDRPGFLANQLWRTPLRLACRPRMLAVFPGLPPAPLVSRVFGERCLTFMHDFFSFEHEEELTAFARLYLRPAQAAALARSGRLLTYSAAVERQVKARLGPRARVTLCRPLAANRFGLEPGAYAREGGGAIEAVMLGTVEPRKRHLAAAAVAERLEAELGRPVKLHVIGRGGWGGAADRIADEPRVVMHGYLGLAEVRQVVARSHMAWFASRDEGLGLPPLELSYSGIPLVVSDIPSFRETLGDQALFVDWTAPASAAAQIARAWREQAFGSEADRLQLAVRWSALAEADMARLVAELQEGVRPPR